jgi:hypothetical protein
MANRRSVINYLICFLSGCAIATVASCLLVKYHRHAVTIPPTVSELPTGIVVRFPEHPPWASSHVIDVSWRQNGIELTECYSVFGFWMARPNNQQPVYLSNFPEGETGVYYFGSAGMTNLGQVRNVGGKLTWEQDGVGT